MAANNRGSEAGFTLLEVLIALAIMTVAFASILSAQSSSINASQRARTMNIVGMLAKGKMIEVENKFEGKPFEEVKKEDGGTFPAPYETYRWTATVKEVEFPSLAALSGEGGGSATDNKEAGSAEIASMISKALTNFFSKAMREVTVTIFWKKGPGEQSFSVSTYWVNLNHEFNPTP